MKPPDLKCGIISGKVNKADRRKQKVKISFVYRLVSCGHYCLSFVLPYQITSLVSCGHYVCRYLHTFPNLHYLYTLYVYIYIYLYTNEILTFCFLRSALFTLPDIIPHFRSGGFMEVCKSEYIYIYTYNVYR
jgi:hypothetical protein